MEVTKKNVAMLSNFEVYQLLQSTHEKTKRKRIDGRSQNVATIMYETLDYLSKTPCAQQNPEVLEKFMKTLTTYKLTKAEKLQLLNMKPTSAVELQLIIDDIEERFSDEEAAKLLELIHTLLEVHSDTR